MSDRSPRDDIAVLPKIQKHQQTHRQPSNKRSFNNTIQIYQVDQNVGGYSTPGHHQQDLPKKKKKSKKHKVSRTVRDRSPNH